jgi:hypothetical protein
MPDRGYTEMEGRGEEERVQESTEGVKEQEEAMK